MAARCMAACVARCAVQEFAELMVMRWFVLRQSALSHAMIDSTINSIVQEISAAAERCHCDRWPSVPRGPCRDVV
jgi:hypothetical protein